MVLLQDIKEVQADKMEKTQETETEDAALGSGMDRTQTEQQKERGEKKKPLHLTDFCKI